MLWLVLLACDDRAADCTPASLVGSTPTDGDQLVRLDAALSLTLDQPAQDAEVFIDGGGTSGAWWPLEDGLLEHTVVPAALEPDQDYTATLRTCGQEADTLSFSTLPAPLGEAVVGRTYVLDLLGDDLTWIEPPNLPEQNLLAFALAETTALLLMPTAAGEALSLLGSFGEPDGDSYRQHDCISPAVLDDVDFTEDPWFKTPPTELTLSDRSSDLVLRDAVIEGIFAEGGDALLALTVSMTLDVRQIISDEDNDYCGAIADLYGATCLPCPDQDADTAAPSCALLEVFDPRAEAIDIELTTAVTPGEGC